MADIIQYLAIIIGIVNICLLIGLLSIYLKTYKQVKAQFTIGLVFFVSLVLIETVFSTLSFVLFHEFRAPPNGGFIGKGFSRLALTQLTQSVFRCIAFSILYKISRE